MTTTTWLTMAPLDTIMVRDGRPFAAGAVGRAQGTVPPPSTLGGVVKAAHGKNVERIVGPVVQISGNSIFPMPADIVLRGDETTGRTVQRLLPAERDDTEHSDLDDGGRLPYSLTGEGDPLGGWITLAGLAEWLAQGAIRSGAEVELPEANWRLRQGDEPWQPERRIGLARHVDGRLRGTAIAQLLYAANHLRPVEGLAFAVGCEDPGPVTVADPVVPIGGRGRLATVAVEPYAVPFPESPGDFPDGRLAVYVATPALMNTVRWEPAGARLCALAVTGPQPVATASPGRFGATRQLFWTVPAGSVYYLKFDTAADAKAWSTEYHGRLLPGASYPIVTAGFGTCLTGRW
ncbi:type III-B CRISPR module-associated Cmr3 family protein [Actinokineospora sp.]|uniref:type III-B CRISPR module-associated Cmr3 family protein n=1 Tax=Actinokineospora sp. TaxID=1872133 RepID=UPI0040383120